MNILDECRWSSFPVVLTWAVQADECFGSEAAQTVLGPMMQQPRSFRGVKLFGILWRRTAIRQQVIEGILVDRRELEGDDVISGTRGAVSDSAILRTLDDSS